MTDKVMKEPAFMKLGLSSPSALVGLRKTDLQEWIFSRRFVLC